MSDPDPADSTAVASHTLAYLRRIEKLQQTMLELLMRQQTRIDRVERDMREGFGRVEQDVGRVERDIGELKGDLIIAENNILNRMNENLAAASHLRDHDERLDALEKALRISATEQGTN